MKSEISIKFKYTFAELSDKAKEKARDSMRDTNDGYYEWEDTKEDAKEVGIKLKGTHRQRMLGSFIEDACYTAYKIIDGHGETCETHKTSVEFLKHRDEILAMAETDQNGDFVDEYKIDQDLDKCESEYLLSILEDYLIITEKQAEYSNSNECIDELIKANEYEFNEDGTL